MNWSLKCAISIICRDLYMDWCAISICRDLYMDWSLKCAISISRGLDWLECCYYTFCMGSIILCSHMCSNSGSFITTRTDL